MTWDAPRDGALPSADAGGHRGAVPFGPRSRGSRVVILPGLGGSGPDHWQSIWERAHPDAVRFEPASVDEPDLDDWIAAVDRAVETVSARPVLVAHSLGTIAATAWMALRPGRALAALLVAPPDPSRPDAPEVIRGFTRGPRVHASVPVTVIASRDDPYAAYGHAASVAADLGAELVDAGERGHLNADSGLGAWPGGLDLLERLLGRAAGAAD
ncbi:alpha/beta hydrolase [Demequina sp. NBRC 110056]|uniref:RBBP9/YdeN family alpha/beta hydrolase n=1 Tax=Demequina sp. NBRC 110056 TaxID=1570345 RepID=UPI0009FBF8BC|nr:alpha/beta hydrolase [Demequina sp. NBRC 110056]